MGVEALAQVAAVWMYYCEIVKRPVRTAALLVSCVAALLVVEAIGFWLVQGRFHTGHFVRHVLGALLWILVAWALVRHRRWAWWVVICIGGALSVLGVLLLVILLFLPPARINVGAAIGLGSLAIPMGVSSVAALAGSVAMLLTRGARDAFFPQPKQN